jgi:cysteine-rich repeat protein
MEPPDGDEPPAADAGSQPGEDASTPTHDDAAVAPEQDAAAPTADAGTEPLQTLTGRVVSSRDGLPIVGASVRVRDAQASSATDEEGNFSLEVLPGSAIEVLATGFVPHERALGLEQDLEVFLQPVVAEVVVDTQAGGSALGGENARVVVPRGMQLQNAAGEIVEGEVTLQVAAFDLADASEAQALPQGDAYNLQGEKVHLTLSAAMEISASAHGEPLNIAEGSHFEVELPAPSDSAPIEGTFWHFDVERGVWQEEIAAIRTSTETGAAIYRARVPHLSYWASGQYCTLPEACVTGRVVLDGMPVTGASISSHLFKFHYYSSYSSCSGSLFRSCSTYYSYYFSYDYASPNCVAHADGGVTDAEGRFKIWGTPGRTAPHRVFSSKGFNHAELTYPQAGGDCADVGDVVLKVHDPSAWYGCGNGATNCDGTCRDTYSDPQHCGSCSYGACEDGMVCVTGECSCPLHTTTCANWVNNAYRPVCADTRSDRNHCGTCNTRCADHEECVLSECVPASCPEGYTRCGRTCVDLALDNSQHCGACDHACELREICREGACEPNPSCGDGFVDAPEVCDDGVNDGSYGGCKPGCMERAARCGDGVWTPTSGELCDVGSAKECPQSCADTNPCTVDALLGSPASCNASCTHTAITQRVAGDSCCPGGANANTDGDCAPVCGNGVKEPGEACDKYSNDGRYDGCMPGCQALGPHCGDGVFDENEESCEAGTASPCATSCDDQKACTADSLVGSASTCNAECVHREITAAADGDACCLPGSNANLDADCAPVCGNGIVERTEVCDDGTNDGRYGTCAVGCKALAPRCGDGAVQADAGETCEPGSATPCPASCDDENTCTVDGSTGSADTCTLTCTHQTISEPAPGDLCCPEGANSLTDADCPAVCGNNVVELAEACDDGVNDGSYDGCATDCKALGPHCGDEIVQLQHGELCDGASCNTDCNDQFGCTKDSYRGSGADCTGHCIHEPVTEPKDFDQCCPDGANANTDKDCDARCGNSVVEPGEACDDGGHVDGDGCSWSCESNETCGNGVTDGIAGEVCDDGKKLSGDGCSADCKSDEQCGNRVVDGAVGEVCDDGNTASDDGCSANCRSTEQCGNGTTDPDEACDDGNDEGGDGCNADCSSDESCGNGIVDEAAGEICDDGAQLDGDGCSADCASNESCGNGVRDPSEACDDGNQNADDGCNASCTSDETCGNDYRDPGEACDDGNNTSSDGCNASCTSDESCGNDVLDPHERCEDGNTANDDGCNATCTSDELCGTGFVDPGEACDDGNTSSEDGCNATCTSDESCGNGVTDPEELCDDGNSEAGDSCSPDCTSMGVCENGACDGATLAVGSGFTCAIRDEGVVCWGSGFYGAIGNGSTTNAASPTHVTDMMDAVALSAGRDHVCALRSTGDVRCWGRNRFYALGDGTTTDSSSPVEVTARIGTTGAFGDLPAASGVAAGGDHSCAIKADGTGYCWGYNNWYQLGSMWDGTGSASRADVIYTLTDAKQISAGLEHSCALLNTGGVRCWGRGSYGQLGNGSSGTGSSTKTPVTVSGLSDAVGVAAGSTHTCAVHSSGGVSCWGLNPNGELGDGTTTAKTTPNPVSGISDAVAVTAGPTRSCALHATGRVSCWGSGWLGDGTNTGSLTPVYVTDLLDAVEVSTSQARTCALRATGDIVCWGASWLGNSVNTSSMVPVTVHLP